MAKRKLKRKKEDEAVAEAVATDAEATESEAAPAEVPLAELEAPAEAPSAEVHPVATLEEAIALCGGEESVKASKELETEFVLICGPTFEKVRIPKLS